MSVFVDLDIVWNVATQDLPALIVTMGQIVGA
jgi:uncharacterized protein with HEPN domain